MDTKISNIDKKLQANNSNPITLVEKKKMNENFNMEVFHV